MNPVPLFLIIVSLPLLLGGCGEKPVSEVKPVEEKVLKVKEEAKTEEPVALTKPAEAVSVSPHLKYEIKDGTVTISRCDRKALGTITIPATIEGNPVTSIGLQAFSGCRGLTSITIPDSVTTIGVRAISFCTNLTSITIPDSITSIGEDAFEGCSSLKSIRIPDSVTSIGGGAFRWWRSLTSITIPDSVTSIGSLAFYECTNLTAVTFLGDAPKDGRDVFKGATPTIYRKPEAKGWGDTFAGRPVKLIGEKP